MLSESPSENNETFLRCRIDTSLPGMGLLLKLLWRTGTSAWRASSLLYIYGDTEAAAKHNLDSRTVFVAFRCTFSRNDAFNLPRKNIPRIREIFVESPWVSTDETSRSILNFVEFTWKNYDFYVSFLITIGVRRFYRVWLRSSVSTVYALCAYRYCS